MQIKASTMLRNNYGAISDMARETGEPIYITRNGEGDLVLMSIEAFEKREELLRFRGRVLSAEEERLSGAPTKSVSEARRQLMERANAI